MQDILRSRPQNVSVELMAAVAAGAALLGLSVAKVSRSKVCGKLIYILP